MPKRSFCPCGYEGRSDNVKVHMRTCKHQKEKAMENEYNARLNEFAAKYNDIFDKHEEMKEAYENVVKENEGLVQKINEAYFNAKEEESSKEGVIYLLKTRESIRMNEDVYKIGRTKNMKNRLSQYPKGSEFITTMKVNDQQMCERVLLYTFKDKFQKREDMGNEYFEGNLDEMKSVLFGIARLFA